MRTLSERRGLAVAVVGALAGAALTATAGSQTWLSGVATVAAPGGRVSGSVAAPLVLAAGLVGLAGAGALLATGGLARRILGLFLVVLAAGAGTTTVRVLAHPAARFAAAAVPGVGDGDRPVTLTAWPFIALLGIVVLGAAGALTVLAGRHWPVLGRRYQRSGRAESRAAGTRTGPAADWDDLDAGRDPTLDPVPGATVRGAAPEDGVAPAETEQQWRSATRTVTPPPGGTAR